MTGYVDIIDAQKFSSLKVEPLIASAGQNSIFKISFASTIAIGDYVVAEFPSVHNGESLFDPLFSQPQEFEGSNLGCAKSDNTQIVCRIVYGNTDGANDERPVLVYAKMLIAITSLVELYIPQIMIYSTPLLSSHIRVRHFTAGTNTQDYSTGAEGII